MFNILLNTVMRWRKLICTLVVSSNHNRIRKSYYTAQPMEVNMLAKTGTHVAEFIGLDNLFRFKNREQKGQLGELFQYYS